MRHAVEPNGIFERSGDMLLLDNIVKRLWAPFASRHLI